VRDVLRDNYLGISELFKSYSSAGSGLSTSDMDFMEWSVFMHDVKVMLKSEIHFKYSMSRDHLILAHGIR
jgi:hypothetical protein